MSNMDNSDYIFGTAAIVGVGLIGGSLGMALRNRGLVRRVIGIGRSEEKLMRAKALGAVDDYTLDLDHGASDADLIVICTPVRDIVPTIQRMASSFKAGVVVTDVGSTKREVTIGAEAVMPADCHFIGGHPMAGSEESGVEAAREDLLHGATYVVTPTDKSDLTLVAKMAAMIDGIGANAEIMPPDKHDEATAIISHLPHAMAAALLQIAEDKQREAGTVFRLAAGSFRDLTRISDSPPEIWRDISLTNSDALIDSIDKLVERLAAFKSALRSGDEEAVAGFFREAKEIREAYLRIARK